MLFLPKREPFFLSNSPAVQHFVFCKNLPPPSSPLMLHGVWDGGAGPKGPIGSSCPLGWASRVLLPRLPRSVLSVRQVGRLVARFADKVKSNSEGGNDWLGETGRIFPDSQTQQTLEPVTPIVQKEGLRPGESHAKAGQSRSWPGRNARDRGGVPGGMRAMKGPRFLLTPGSWPEDQDPRGPTYRAAGLRRVFEPGSPVPATMEPPPPGFAPQLCLSGCVTLGRSLASLSSSNSVSSETLWSSGEKMTNFRHNDIYCYANSAPASLTPLPPTNLEPHTSLFGLSASLPVSLNR